jgi:hypothetical protein
MHRLFRETKRLSKYSPLILVHSDSYIESQGPETSFNSIIKVYTLPSPSLIKALINRRTSNIQRRLIHILTISQIGPIRTQHINILSHDIITHRRATACKRANLRIILCRRVSIEVLEYDVGNRKRGRELETEGEIRLTVALVHFDGVVYVVDDHGVVGYVVDLAATAASLQVAAELGWQVRPDLDACAVLFLSTFMQVEVLFYLTHSSVVH